MIFSHSALSFNCGFIARFPWQQDHAVDELVSQELRRRTTVTPHDFPAAGHHRP